MTLCLLTCITNKIFIGLTMTWKIEQTNDLLNYRDDRVAETTMPSMERRFVDSKSLSCERYRERVKTIVTSPFKKKPPRCPILNKKESRVKFKEHIIINSKVMNRNKTLCGLRNIENMISLRSRS
jgi:hypothetical protein